MSKLEDYAKRELTVAGLFRKDSDYGGMIGKDVMELVKQFSKQGHSGFSAELTLRVFSKVAAYEPLEPLTGEDSEWTEIREGVWQNKRCSHVFKENGEAYDQEGRIFVEPDGATFVSHDSRVPVSFPYTPKREYVPRVG